MCVYSNCLFNYKTIYLGNVVIILAAIGALTLFIVVLSFYLKKHFICDNGILSLFYNKSNSMILRKKHNKGVVLTNGRLHIDPKIFFAQEGVKVTLKKFKDSKLYKELEEKTK